MLKKYLTKSPGQTKKLGQSLAKTLLRNRFRGKAIVLGLRGGLGGGKTTFLQGFAKGLGIGSRILSPTFIIVRRTGHFYHIDCYRIQKPQELIHTKIIEWQCHLLLRVQNFLVWKFQNLM